MSNAKRDGYAIKGPDGFLPRTLRARKSSPWACREAIPIAVCESFWKAAKRDLGQMPWAEFNSGAKALGYELVPVRLVEVEGDDGE